MKAATGPIPSDRRLLSVNPLGVARHLYRADLAAELRLGDLVVANNAATLPASLAGVHRTTGVPVEIRLAGWVSLGDPTRFTALVFGDGDHRTPTEDRPPPPALTPGDRLRLGPLEAVIEHLDHPRLARLRFSGCQDSIFSGIARHGRPIQYAHVSAPLALWDTWTGIADRPLAFEPPSAGFVLDWRMVAAWRKRGIGFATLEHAAGLSSTGDSALDGRLPFDEAYRIPPATAVAVARTRMKGGRVIAIGTTVVRALEASAASNNGDVRSGDGVATGRITRQTRLRVVDAIVSGVHEPGESHYDLLRAFADDAILGRMAKALRKGTYHTHEFGDFVLIERR